MAGLLGKGDTLTKEDVIRALREVADRGWIPSGRARTNVGAVGNTLEDLLGLPENNLPIPNAHRWELKSQRRDSASLVTLFHSEPYPRKARIIPQVLLPGYGWAHQTLKGEMSFRSTTPGNGYTDRGFTVIVDRAQAKVRFHFDPTHANQRHAAWLASVRSRSGLGPITPEPYWPFSHLDEKTRTKISNMFFVLADCRRVEAGEEFWYREVWLLEDYEFNRFLECIESGTILVDFDARTGHNHGTKFRIRAESWTHLYRTAQRVVFVKEWSS